MKDLLDDLLKRIRAYGDVGYADARWVEDGREQIRVRNREVTAISRATSSGVGFRVLARGAWGFAATSALEPGALEGAASRAVEVARASAGVSTRSVRLADEEPRIAAWVSPRGTDPFEVPQGDKIQLFVRGPRPSNLFLARGDRTLDELVGMVERGLYVTRFHYVNGFVDTRRAVMTGMTRDGTFLIENGRLTRGVANLRFTDSLLEALARVEGATSARRAVPTWWTDGGAHVAPAILVRGFRFTGERAP